MLWMQLRVKALWLLRRAALVVVLVGGLAACSRDFPMTPTGTPRLTTPTALSAVGPLPAAEVTPTPWPYPWTDASAVMSGICFESAYDAAGRTFIIESGEELSRFYDLADNSELCRQPVTRQEFEFGDGRVLAGLWSRAVGCTARHEVDNVARDDTARTYFIYLRLVVEGDCPYELVRPFWIGVSGLAGYEIQIAVQ